MSDVQVQVKLDIKQEMEGTPISVHLRVLGPEPLDSDQPVLAVEARGVPASNEGASEVASMLRTAADAIDQYLGRETETHVVVDGTGEEVARVQTHVPKTIELSDVERAISAQSDKPKPRPRFNPKPRGA